MGEKQRQDIVMEMADIWVGICRLDGRRRETKGVTSSYLRLRDRLEGQFGIDIGPADIAAARERLGVI